MASSVNPNNEFGPRHQSGQEGEHAEGSTQLSSSEAVGGPSQYGAHEQKENLNNISLPKVPEVDHSRGARTHYSSLAHSAFNGSGVSLLRDPGRIPQVLSLLREVWVQDPSVTFVGLLSSLLQERSSDEFSDPSARLWNCEEYEWVGLLNARRNEGRRALGHSDMHEAVLGEVGAVWRVHPDLRLGQLVISACSKVEDVQGATIHISAIGDVQLIRALAAMRQQIP
jgi:hypothetical protein